MLEHVDACGLESAGDGVEPQVLERAAGEDHRAGEPARLPQARTSASATPSWKAAAISSRASRLEVVDDGRHEVGSDDPAAFDPTRVRLGRDVGRQLLELDRRLALVAHGLTEPEHRGDGVEQPSCAGRERRVHREALTDERPARPTARDDPRARGTPPRRAMAPGSRARRPGAGRGRATRAARTRRGRQQQLAAPQRPVRPIPVPSRTTARAPRSRRARPGRRRRARGGAAPRRAATPARAPSAWRGTGDGDRMRSPRARPRACRGRGRGRRERLGRRPRRRGRRGGGEERLRAAHDAERALQLGPDRDERPGGHRQLDRLRDEPARAPDREASSDDRVLAAAVDRPIVGEDEVGDVAEPSARVVVVDRDRLVGQVPARHHERPADVVQEEVVEWRVGEQEPDPGRARGDGRGERGLVASRRARSGARRLRAGRAPRGELGEQGGVGGHHCERLLLAALARAQACDRALVGRVAGEVVAAEPLDGDDAALAQDCDRLLERDRQPRPAGRAGDRLGVEAAVGRILVLATAVVAQREAGHRRVGTVVGHRGDDREARPAARAVHERVAVAAVGGVEELAEAVVAGGHVGRDEGGRAAPLARDDLEARSGPTGHPAVRTSTTRASTGASATSATTNASSAAAALDVDHDSVAVVEHDSRQPVPREPVDVRSEPDPLHHAAHAQATALRGRVGRHPPSLPFPPVRNGPGAYGVRETRTPRRAARMPANAPESTLELEVDEPGRTIDLDGLDALLGELRDRGYRVIGPTRATARSCSTRSSAPTTCPPGGRRSRRRPRIGSCGATTRRCSGSRRRRTRGSAGCTRRGSGSGGARAGRRAARSRRSRHPTVRSRSSACARATSMRSGSRTGLPGRRLRRARLRRAPRGRLRRRRRLRRARRHVLLHVDGHRPARRDGADIVLTELLEGEHRFLAAAGSERGAALLAGLPGRDATDDDLEAAQRVTDAARADGPHARLDRPPRPPAPQPRPSALRGRRRALPDLRQLHARVPDVLLHLGRRRDPPGGRRRRAWRRWDSCFSVDYSYIHGGSIRPSPRARYRQWLTHKFATWIDQFGTSGCVGCGRCITWCPVGIDVTEELAAIRETDGEVDGAHAR